jgi:hypothetical protein
VNLNINVNVNICKDQEESNMPPPAYTEEMNDYGSLKLQGASSRSAKRPGDQGGGIRASEHPLLNINGAKSSVNFYREGNNVKGRVKKTSMLVNAFA